MNRDLLKRLFKSISLGDLDEINSMARVIINHESEVGHKKLSNELEKILSSSKVIEKNKKIMENKNSGNSLVSLPRSRRQNQPLVIRKDLYNLDHSMVLPKKVEESFERIEKEFVLRDKLALYGLLHKSKIMLYGPPGCGKTLGAQRLAWKLGLPFYKVRLEAVFSSYLGESSMNLNEVFSVVNEKPCLLFIDEFDSIASTRASRNDIGEIRRIVNSFLQFLDDYKGKGIIVTATNLPEQLDEALWRRFDEVVYMPKPGRREIEMLIKLTLGNFDYFIFDWLKIVDTAIGLSSSEIVQACKDAAKYMVINGDRDISEEVLLESLCKMGRDIDDK